VEGEALACGLLTGLKTGYYMTAKSEKRKAKSEKRKAKSEKRKAKSGSLGFARDDNERQDRRLRIR
jgi:hypothetical protein